MTTQSCELVFGPPGTGKTTHLIREAEREIERGTEPERIAYVSFTRAAILEARDRAREHLKLPQKRFPWFRTIHSFAFKQLAVERDAIMTRRDYAKFGLQLSASAEEYALTRDDRLLLAHTLVRATKVDIAFIKLQRNLDVAELDYREFAVEIKAWMRRRDKLEFADLLDDYIARGEPLPVDVAFIDEAQDLTPQQWRVIWVAFRNARRIVIAGDDDQAIFEWAGADVGRLLRQPGTRIVLGRSFRVPEYIRRYADLIIQRLSPRVPKEWSGTEFEHPTGVGRLLHLSEISFRYAAEESYLLLARHQCHLQEMSQWLRNNGQLHFVNDELSVPTEVLTAAAQLRRIRGGARLPVHQCRELIALSPGRVRMRLGDCVSSAELETLVPLGRVTERALVAEADAFNRWGETIPRTPRIRLSTIHAAKGQQADNVVVNPAQTRSAAPLPNEALSADARLFYVAATRARRRLAVLNQPTLFRYEMPL
jgi:superfamily I DNA/RNA helicase